MTAHQDTAAWPELPPGPHGTPSPALAERYRSRPVAPTTVPSGDSIDTAVGYDDVRALLTCPHSSRDLSEPGLPRLVEGMSVDDVPDVLINMDGPEHARQRRILARAFTVASAERWRVSCREIAHDLLDQADHSGVDLVADYALPLSSRVICQVLGVPTQDYPRFRSWSSAFLSASSSSMAARMAAFSDFMSYSAQLVAARRANPGRDLVDDLIHARDGEDRLSEDELITLLFALITAGLETTTMMISRGAYRLLLHPERYRELVATPSLLHSTVEEILRYDGPGTPGLLRRLTADLELPSGAV
ncbi:cytochrome P450, partial [Nonomuraea sp. NPDC049695]|uniref:cytochrome P450 n=1 Tax=Nonomuraea sp. NPDC049695 TaxID=3154734 RepID=UPI0034404912